MPRFIVVDDDPAILTVFERYLTYRGHEFRTVTSAREAVHLLDTWEADALITDISMPEMDGIELISAIRKRTSVAIIAMSGGGAVAVDLLLRSAELLGAAVTLEKPFDVARLDAAIAQALEGSANQG